MRPLLCDHEPVPVRETNVKRDSEDITTMVWRLFRRRIEVHLRRMRPLARVTGAQSLLCARVYFETVVLLLRAKSPEEDNNSGDDVPRVARNDRATNTARSARPYSADSSRAPCYKDGCRANGSSVRWPMPHMRS